MIRNATLSTQDTADGNRRRFQAQPTEGRCPNPIWSGSIPSASQARQMEWNPEPRTLILCRLEFNNPPTAVGGIQVADVITPDAMKDEDIDLAEIPPGMFARQDSHLSG